MSYYITTPFKNTIAKIWFSKPEEPSLLVETIPEGIDPLHLIDGELIRIPKPPEIIYQNPVESLQKETLILKSQIQFQTERADLLEGALIEIASMVVE